MMASKVLAPVEGALLQPSGINSTTFSPLMNAASTSNSSNVVAIRCEDFSEDECQSEIFFDASSEIASPIAGANTTENTNKPGLNNSSSSNSASAANAASNTNNNNEEESSLDLKLRNSHPLSQQELAEKVLELVNFYFGEDNYSKDQFLRKQAVLDGTGEGWIGVDVICSFKRMKKLTEDRALVLEAMRQSPLVLLNADESKIRRKEILVKDIEEALAKTVILGNIPDESTDETIKALCAAHGTVARVRFLVVPHDPLPSDIQMFCLTERGEFKSGLKLIPHRLYALAEFVTMKQAATAARVLHNAQDWRSGLTAAVLHKKAKGGDSALASPVSSVATSATASRSVSPFVPSTSSLIVERARASSFNARMLKERSVDTAATTTTTTASPAGTTGTGSSTRDDPVSAPHTSSSRAAALEYQRPRSNSLDRRSWRQPSLPTSASERGATPPHSPLAGRRHLSPDAAAASARTASPRSTPLSHMDRPAVWPHAGERLDRLDRAPSPSPSSSSSCSSSHPRVSSIIRQPRGPNGTRGFAGSS